MDQLAHVGPKPVICGKHAVCSSSQPIVTNTMHYGRRAKSGLAADHPFASQKGARVLGPDTAGLISPGKCKLGVHPNRMFLEGNVGVLSKSGALSYEVCKNLTESGIGQSTVVGIGGGPFWGMTQTAVLEMFQADLETKVVVMLGEVGGTMELEAAEYIKDYMTKPVVSLIVGRSAPEGTQMGHAGAIIEGKEGTATNKINTLQKVGVRIAYSPSEIPQIIKSLGVLS